MSYKTLWPSNWIFILAAIGSAAGLGSLWRFPFLAFEHGGGAFLVAYIIANIVLGVPLLALEIALGQKTGRGAPDAFGVIRPVLRYVGWAAILMGFMVLAYYMSVVGWGIHYLFSAIDLSWGSDTKNYFFNNVLNLSDGPSSVGGLSSSALVGLLAAWIVVYFSVWKSVRSVAKIVRWSVIAPFIILAIFIIRAVTLPGSSEGLALFLFPDWSALLSPSLWLAAFSQVFFALSLAFGIMVAYGSLKEQGLEIMHGVWMIVIGTFLTAFMAGLVVFGTLGYMAHEQGVAVTEVVAGGPALAFIVFPQAINLLPGWNEFFGVLFFLMFFSLALDSAFSLLEAFATSIRDRLRSISSEKITLALSAVGLIAGIPFVTGAGLYYLDIVDHFIVNYGLVIVGMLEALAVGWMWNIHKLSHFINERSHLKVGAFWKNAIRFIVPGFLLLLLVLNIIEEIRTPHEGYPLWALFFVGILPVLLVPVIAFFLDRKTTQVPTLSPKSSLENTEK